MLTTSEIKILQLIANGKTKKEIAQSFGTASSEMLKTTKTICNKLNAKNTTNAVYLGYCKKYIK